MPVNSKKIQGINYLYISDDTDSSNSLVLSHLLNEFIVNRKERRIIIDMSDLQNINTRLIGAIVNYALKLDKHNYKMGIININENIKKLFSMANLTHMVRIFKSEEEAFNYMIEHY